MVRVTARPDLMQRARDELLHLFALNFADGTKHLAALLAAVEREAIERLREPTQAMVIAAEKQHGLLEGLCYEAGWLTMFDVAIRALAAPETPRSRPIEALPERDWKREGDDR